jgi:peptidoglycan/LPS O-acetylase OafA/YrhL
MGFRKDINGLRALAVLPVLFFHAEWKVFSGGFLGVDVFFVISGFLITSLILKDLKAGNFSILSFYDRRARRILPALLLICLATTLLSFIFMLPYDLKNYGQSLVATILSANNILLYLTSGYWSLAAEFKPLYQTWSLGVEEQYYMIIPVLFMVAYRIAKNKIRAVSITVVVLFLISYIFSFYSDNKEFNFLIISHRMWELLAGSLVAILLIRKTIKNSTVMAIIGLLLILLSYLFPFAVSSNQAVYSLIPVIGTVLIIIFSSDSLITGKFLSLRPLLLIGTLSYSIYLLHMPILAFLRLSTEGKPSVLTQLVFVLLSVPLAYLSWKFVENIFRDRTIVPNKYFYSINSVLAILLLCGGLVLHKTYGLQKYSPQYSYGVNPQKYADRPYMFAKKDFVTTEKKHLLIIGNSFARDFANMMIECGVTNSYEIVYLFNITSDIELSKKLIASADITIAVSSAGMAAREVESEKLAHNSQWLYNLLMKQSNDGQFLLVGTKNFGWNNNFVLRKSINDLIDYKVKVNSTSLEANQIEKRIWGEHYVDIISTISSDGVNVPLFTPNAEFISFDTEHVTKNGAIYLGEILLKHTILKDIINL